MNLIRILRALLEEAKRGSTEPAGVRSEGVFLRFNSVLDTHTQTQTQTRVANVV